MTEDLETMERIIPDNISPEDAPAQLSLQLHLERYHFACKYLLPGRTLDIACGAGYGTWLLAECSHHPCTGADISPEAIAYATNRYVHPNVHFVRQELLQFDETGFTNIVSLETIEHIPHPERVAAHLHRLLLPGGRLIVSAPVTPSTDGNPFHVNDFTERSFRKLFVDQGFEEVDCLRQRQPYSLKEIFQKKSARTDGVRQGLIKYYLMHPGKFFLRIRSLMSDGLTNNYLTLVLRKVK